MLNEKCSLCKYISMQGCTNSFDCIENSNFVSQLYKKECKCIYKIGDKVEIIEYSKIDNAYSVGEVFEIYNMFRKNEFECEFVLSKKNCSICISENSVKLYKGESNMKTFKEVIADIKEGEVWKSEQIWDIEKIEMKYGDLIISRRNKDYSNLYIKNSVKYTLQRKKVSFTEAFKAYEEGKEIESCVSGIIKRNTEYGESFDREEIRGEWYINA